MDGAEAQCADLARFIEVAQVSPAEGATGVAAAAFLHRARVFGILGVAQVDAPLGREERAVARDARGQHAVEHIYAAIDRLDDVLGRADAHQVARLIGGQRRAGFVQRGVHLRFGLAHSQAADGVAGEVKGREEVGAGLAQIGEDAALHDAEQRLVRPRVGCFAALCPTMRARQGLFIGCPVQGIGTFVQYHGDVRAERLLDRHDALRREAVQAAVDMAAKGHAVIVQPAVVGQAEDLIAAGIGEDGAVIGHKSVQPAQALDQLMAGAQIEVIGVGEDQLAAGFGKVARLQRLDIGKRAHRRKGGHVDGAVRRVKDAKPCGAV